MPKKTKKRKANPRRRPATADEVEAAKKKSQKQGETEAFVVFFSCIRDKEGFGLKRMVRVWRKSENVIREILSGKTDYPKLDAEIYEYCGLRLFNVNDFDQSGSVTGGDVVRARNWAKKMAEQASFCLYFTALRRSEKYGPERLRRVWKEIEYMRDSLRRGMVTAKDLRDALAEEAGFCFDMDIPGA